MPKSSFLKNVEELRYLRENTGIPEDTLVVLKNFAELQEADMVEFYPTTDGASALVITKEIGDDKDLYVSLTVCTDGTFTYVNKDSRPSSKIYDKYFVEKVLKISTEPVQKNQTNADVVNKLSRIKEEIETILHEVVTDD